MAFATSGHRKCGTNFCGKDFSAGEDAGDFGLSWRKKEIFGSHKTYRGLVSGTILGFLVFGIQKIISFAVHFRNLVDFYYSVPKKTSQNEEAILAEHFFISPLNWQEIRPLKTAALRRSRDILNKHLAHLTYHRVGQSVRDCTWDFSEIICRVFDFI